MNPAVQAVICGRRRQQITRTFTANATWTAPLTTSRIDTASGKGAAGAPSYSDPNTQQTVTVMTVFGSSSTGPSSGYASGTLGWSSLRAQALNYQTEINAGGAGSDTALAYTQYTDSKYTQVGSPVNWANAIAGTASAAFIAFPSSGSVTPGANATATVTYTQQGATHAATTGASTNGFGKTFPGGTGGAAAVTTFSNLIVTPGATYNIVVPTGGSVTITYFQ